MPTPSRRSVTDALFGDLTPEERKRFHLDAPPEPDTKAKDQGDARNSAIKAEKAKGGHVFSSNTSGRNYSASGNRKSSGIILARPRLSPTVEAMAG